MKNYFFYLICILLCTNISAQMITKDSIIGSYHLSSGNNDPLGGAELIAYPNNRFIVVAFGTIVNGEWKLKDNIVHFIPDYDPDSFILYGRKTTTLKDSVRIIFENFENDNSKYVNFESSPKDSVLNMRQVFNDDANCFSHPYIYKGMDIIQKLRFTTKQDYWDKSTEYGVYTFDNQTAYNDFVAVSNPKDFEKEPFNAIYKNGGLLFNNDKVSIKKDLSELNEEDSVFLKTYANLKILDDVLHNDKEHFPIDLSLGFKIEYYEYDKKNDLYFNPDLEKNKDSFDFDYSKPENSELLPYKRMAKQNVLKQAIKINKKSLFIVKCD